MTCSGSHSPILKTHIDHHPGLTLTKFLSLPDVDEGLWQPMTTLPNRSTDAARASGIE
jgi:hypothetical protein